MLRVVTDRQISRCEWCGQDELQIEDKALKEGPGRGPLCLVCVRGGLCGQGLGPWGPGVLVGVDSVLGPAIDWGHS